MSGSPPDPDQPPSARPVRVVRFDGFSTVEHDPDRAAGAAGQDRPTRGRVADLDGLDDAGAAPARVAAFDALDAPRAAAPPVAGLDALAGHPRDRSGSTPAGLDALAGHPRDRSGSTPATRTSSTAGRPGAAAGDRVAGGPATGDAAPGGAVAGRPVVDGRAAGPAPDDSDDGIPPDAPLPRGRRRRARVGRLGPDGPDPALPERAADPVAVAREICLRLLTDRARTRQELAQALARKGVPAEAAATVLDRFDEVGLIDDAAFAGQWVRSRHAVRGLGRRAIAVELRRKGVADDVAGEALAEVDADAEARRARELVDRKLRSMAVDTADERAAAGRRLVGMLARKGYGAGIAYRVVREALAERGADVDELGTDPAD